jgi:natural product biosynthesis luciferase-like monooxygenase protein
LDETSLAFLQYTSGSTGSPKGVMVSHGNVLSNAAEMQEAFSIRAHDRGVFWLPFYHDMGLMGGVIQPVYSGYLTVIMSPLSFIENPLSWLETISETKGTLSGGPNFAYDLCVQKISADETQQLDLSSWRVAFNGSEPVRQQTLQAFASKFRTCGFDGRALRPCYGLAEATLLVSARNVSMHTVAYLDQEKLKRGRAQQVPLGTPGAKSLVGAGEPGPDHSVLIVNPDNSKICGENEIGEIWISGPNVAQGYWKKLKETKVAFCRRPKGQKNSKYLRTGDLGFLRGKQIFITGRLKDVIIIRGQNFYPQDIEYTVSNSHFALCKGRGAAFSVEVADEERLVVVHELDRRTRMTDIEEIIQSVREQISSEHQLHAYAVVLIRAGSLPKTTSGKVQHQACKDGFIAGTLNAVASSIADGAPQKRLEAATSSSGTNGHLGREMLPQIIEVLSEILGIASCDVNPDTRLSAFGMDSLRAAQIKIEIERATGVDLLVSQLLQGATVRELAQFVETSGGTAAPSNKRGQIIHSTSYPLSAGQKALWYLHQLEPESQAYSIVRGIKIRGPLDINSLRAAFTLLMQRHPSLCMSVSSHQGELIQTITSDRQLPFTVVDANDWNDATLCTHIDASAQQPFELKAGEVLRVQIYLRPGREAVMLLAAHHIALDLWSLATLADELSKAYGTIIMGRHLNLSPVENSYAEFVEWQSALLSGQQGEKLLNYWLKRLENPPPPLVFATQPRQSGNRESNIHHFQIESELTAQLHTLSRVEQVTLHSLLTATFEVLLHRYTGQEDFLLGMLSSGRNRKFTQEVVGYYVNAVVLRPDCSVNRSFTAYLRNSSDNLVAALDHGDLPFNVLVERLHSGRNASRSPLLQVMCIFQPSQIGKTQDLTPFIMGRAGGALPIGDLLFESMEFSERGTQFDLTLVACNDGNKITAGFKYDSKRLDSDFIARLAQHYSALLSAIVAGSSMPIRSLSMLTDTEMRQLTRNWNDTALAFNRDACIHTLIETQAEKAPDNTALVFEGFELTYRELDYKANQLAGYLRNLGVIRESKVGVYLERSLDMIISLLAVLKAGAAYVPLDPTHPAERTASILKASGAGLIITQRYLAARGLNEASRTICLDQDAEIISRFSTQRLTSDTTAENVAYVMFTSGSTGVPKGVMIEHRSVVNFFYGMDARIGCGPEDTLLAVTSISFDISVLELLWPLTRGARVVIIHDQALSSGARPQPIRSNAPELQFSLFYFASADAEGARTHYQMLVEGARLADQFGFAAVWTPERHFHDFGGMYPNPSLTSAALAMITTHVQLRAGSVVLPLHNPIRVAEEWALVDQLSQGRTGIAFASGWHADDFVLAPENYAVRKDIMYRGIETVQQLWRGESIKVVGGAGNEIEVKIHPRPIQRELPIWITSAGSADTFESAARIGGNVLTHLLGQEISEVGEKVQLYRRGLSQAGREPSQGIMTLMLHTYLDHDLDQVRRKALQPFKNYLRSSVGLISSLIRSLKLDLDLSRMQEDDLDDLLGFAAERYMGNSGLFGTPETCLEMAENVRSIGVNEIACLVDFGVDFASTMQSIHHIQEIRDRFNRASEPADYSIASQALRYCATLLQCTPSLMRMLMQGRAGQPVLGSLRALLLGGEPVPLPLVQEISKTFHGRIVNMYGPTETTIWSAAQELNVTEQQVLIGSPIANTQIYVVNPDLQPCPTGITGELCIGGEGVARGYLGDPGLTAERFLPDPFATVPGARIYKTGDLGRFQNDGRIDLAGRADQQVKIRGHRIELGEVEATLNKAPGVRASVALKQVESADETLVAYLVGSDREIELAAVRNFLRNHLPPYMVPGKMHVVHDLPLSPNGKIDRKALPRLQIVERSLPSQSPVAPAGGLQSTIQGIWKEILKTDHISLDDNFFDIGGHSLLMVQVHERIQHVLDRTFPLITLLHHPTVRSITSFLENSGAAAQPTSTPETMMQQRKAVLAQRNRAAAIRLPQ